MKAFCKKHKPLLILAVILLCFALLTAYIWRYRLPEATQTERLIVNDAYTTLSGVLDGTNTLTQHFTVKGGQTVYGVNLNIATFARICRGTLTLEVLDKAGDPVCSAVQDMQFLKDNTFAGFLFDAPLAPEADTAYALRLTAQPETAEDKIALWKTEKVYGGFELEDGTAEGGTAALQYITNYVDRELYKLFALIALLLAAGLAAVYLLCAKKAKTETVFLAAALVLGLVFCVFTPINGGPDEYVHLATSYDISNTLLGVEKAPDGMLTVRECDSAVSYVKPVEYGAFSLSDMARGLFAAPPEAAVRESYVQVEARLVNGYQPVFWPQALGITVGRVLGLGFVPTVIAGRVFNLVFYVLLAWLALRMMPVHKTALALAAMLPMALQLAGSLCYDVYVLALAPLYTAALLREICDPAPLTGRRTALLAVLLALVAPAKAIYVVLALGVLALPRTKFAGRAKERRTKALLLALAAAVWAIFNVAPVLRTVTEHTETPRPELPAVQQALQYPFEIDQQEPEAEIILTDDLDANGDSKTFYSIGYILRHPVQTVRLVTDTVMTQSARLLESTLGLRLGELIVVELRGSTLWLLGMLAALILSLLPADDPDKRLNSFVFSPFQRLVFAGCFVLVLGLSAAACIMWTPVNYDTIFGLQGRYLLPALPLALLALPMGGLRLKKAVDHGLLLTMYCMNAAILLDVFLQRLTLTVPA